MSFPSYPKYKDFGLAWLREIPCHWRIGTLRRLIISASNGTTANQIEWVNDAIAVSRIETISTGEVNFDKVGFVENTAATTRFLLNEGDILLSHINSLAMVGNVALYKGEQPLVHGMNLLRLKPVRGLASSEWLIYWLKSKNIRQEFESRAKPAINQASISTGSVLSTPAVIPPIDEQTQIAHFLDHETAKIDALIHEQERLIELLQEKRQAVISHAVTKGLKPDVPMKDSGVEWLGRVPAHWTSSSIKRFCSLVKDGTHLPPPRVSEGIPLLSVRNIVGGEFVRRSDDSKISENDYVALCRSFTPQQRDVLLAIVGATLGKTAIISDAMGQFHIQRSLALFRADASKLNPHWLHWVFQSAGFQSLLWEYAGFSAQPGIYLGTLASFKIPVPPIKEQIEINEWIGRQIDPMNTLIKEAESAVLLMKERRSSLISAAVTGKIDIRNWQPPADSMVLNEGASELGVEETAAGRKV